MTRAEQELAIQKARAQFVALFLQEVGYHEKASNSQLDDPTANIGGNNWNKFAAHIDSLRALGLNFYNGLKNIGPAGEWCDISYDDVMIRLIMSLGLDPVEAARVAMLVLYQPADSCGAGCEFSAGYYRAAGAWIDRSGTPEPADQIFFGPKNSETHTGAVVDVDDTYVYTVEGNSGNAVQRKQYRRTDSNIAGYGKPNFAVIAYLFVEQEPDPETPIADDVEPTTERDRLLAILGDRWIGTYRDLPDWARPEAMELIKLGALKGTKPVEDPEDTAIGATLSFVRSLIIALRTVKALAGAADKAALADALTAAAEALKQ
jgi:hypothetical protein